MNIKLLSILTILVINPFWGFSKTDMEWSSSGAVESYKYKVTVNGEESFVYMGNGAHFTQFSFLDSAKIIIEMLRGGFAEVAIRPLSKNIPYKRDGKKISFTIYRSPLQLSIEFEHRHNDPLFIFANPPEYEIPDPNAKDLFYFGPGVHEPDVIRLTPEKKTVYLAKGAYVKGSIHATDLEDVKIYGRGILNGDLYDNRPIDSEWRNMVSFKGCTNVQLKDIILSNAQAWNILLLATNKVTIDNIKVVATTGNSDGVDICGARDVTIDQCFFYNNDDCIAFNNLLSSFNYDWEYGKMRPNTSNIKVLNTVLWNQLWGEAIRLGWNTMCEYQSNMLFKDIDIIYSETGAIDMNHGDRGSFRNIVFENINVEDINNELITLRMDGNRTCIDPVRGASETNGIHFKNIRTYGKIKNKRNLIHGLNEVNSFKNISFSNFNFEGKDVQSLSDFNCAVKFAKSIVFSNDSTRPSAPVITDIQAKGPQQIELNWQASIDAESDVIYYNIYRDNEFLDISKTTNFIDYKVLPSSRYIYKITAINSVGLESEPDVYEEINTPIEGNTWSLEESIGKQAHGYNHFFYLNYNTVPMKFYRMPESGYELANKKYTYSTLRLWYMFHDGVNEWHSISNTRDTKKRIDATLTEDGVMSPKNGLDVVIAWKAPHSGIFEIQTNTESKAKGLSFSVALDAIDNLLTETTYFKKSNTGKNKERVNLDKGDFLYFIASTGTDGNVEDGSLKLSLLIKSVK